MRSTIETYIDHIAQGKASYEEVVPHSLEVFYNKFLYFQRKIGNMDALFEANFSTITTTAPKFRSKCGKCKRFMNFLDLKCVSRSLLLCGHAILRSSHPIATCG